MGKGNNLTDEMLVNLYPWAMRIASTFYYNRQDAEDLASDTILRIIRYRSRYDGRRSLRSWAYRIMQSIFINQLRRKSRFCLLEREPVCAADSTARIGFRHMLGVIREAARHSEAVRTVLLSAKGYSVIEIGEKLRIPSGTVKSRLHYGRKLLKKMLEK